MIIEKLKTLIKKNNNLYTLGTCILNYKNLDFQRKVFGDVTRIFYGNIGYDPLKEKKRCLISYITPEGDDESVDYTSMTSTKEKYAIYNSFLELGYVIDICFCNDEQIGTYIDNNYYDVIFGFGSAYRYAVKKWPQALHIGYYTENPFSYSYKKEKERTDYYNKRHNSNKEIYRTGRFYQNQEELLSDAIIHLCSPNIWKEIDVRSVGIFPHGVKRKDCIDDYVDNRDKNVFLVYGNGGVIHKGIDILIDIFNSHPEWELNICGNVDEFQKYPELGHMNDNIYLCGNVDVESEMYDTLVRKSTWVILLSCSEGTPTGVLTCMRHGLIPVVMREGMNFELMGEYSVLLDDYHLDFVEKKLVEITNMDENKIRALSLAVYDFANNCFTLENFRDSFKNALMELIRRTKV